MSGEQSPAAETVAAVPAMKFEGRKEALRQDARGDFVVVLAIHPNDIPPQLLRSKRGARYAVALVEIDDDDIPVDRIGLEERKRALARLSICIKDPLYQEFAFRRLGERGEQIFKAVDADDPTSVEEATRIATCEILGITSRKEIARDSGVTARWIELERVFRANIRVRMVDGRSVRDIRPDVFQ